MSPYDQRNILEVLRALGLVELPQASPLYSVGVGKVATPEEAMKLARELYVPTTPANFLTPVAPFVPENRSLTPASLEREKQNKVSHIVDDLENLGISRDEGYEILLKRGAFKWFAGRRDMIHLKHDLKEVVKQAQHEIVHAKLKGVGHRAVRDALRERLDNGRFQGEAAEIAKRQVQLQRRTLRDLHNRRQYLKGYLRAIEDVRVALGSIAHSPRWRVQDNDSRAQQWLEKQEA